MENFTKVKTGLIYQLGEIRYDGDLSDIGNEIGIVIAKYFDEENTVDDFIHGLKHGISLTDGTHDKAYPSI
jgi:hypothetical protein